MDALVQDIRYGIRQLLRQRGSSAIAILTLALGIGASTAIFSVVDATMLRPLPYPDPDRLVTVGIGITMPDGRVSRPTTAMADMRTWKQATEVFSKVAGLGSTFRGSITGGAEPERIRVARFTEDYLSMHGVSPLIGRDFTEEDMAWGAPAVALLGYGYWQSRHGGRADIVGQTITLDDGVATIIGVLPASFNATTPVSRPLQIAPQEFDTRGTGRVSVHARLQPGITIQQATERLAALTAAEPRPGGSSRPAHAIVTSRLDTALNASRTTISVLAGAVALILLIACVNVAGLLLARGSARQTELAVRASIGASRLRLMRQLLTESIVLAAAGASLGILLAWLTLDAIVANIPLSMPANSPVALNGTVLALTTALLVPIVLLFGLVPALRLSRVRLTQALARGGRQSGSALSRRGSQLLIGAEVALAIVLVTGAGLMLRSFARLSAVDLGFNLDGVITMEVLPLERDPAIRKTYYAELLHRVRTIAGVKAAGIVDSFALGSGTTHSSVRGSGADVGATMFEATPGYLEAIEARLRAGRLLTEAEFSSGFRGAVINEPAARQMFPDGPAVGRQFTRAGDDKTPWTVVGVIGDIRHGGPLASRNENVARVFFPLEPTVDDPNQAMVVVLRHSGSMDRLGAQLRQTAQSVGPRVLVESIRTANDRFSDGVLTPKRRTVLLTLLGALGLVLSLVGVFGMTAYAVSRRTAEIGVRMAFGAQPGAVVRTMMRDAMVPIVIGTAVGLGGAYFASRTIESFLFNTVPTDAVTFATVALTLVGTGCLAALVPAVRAARIDPVITLRAE